MANAKLKVHIVHDWIDSHGGAEKVLESIDEVCSADKIFTLLANPKSILSVKWADRLVTSPLQKIPFAFQFHRLLLSFYPRLIEQFDLSEADLIFSSSHCVAKGAMTRADQTHISYIHTPPRYIWDLAFSYLRENSIDGLKRLYVERVFSKLRLWDVTSSNRVDLFIANSETVAKRIWRCYRRPSLVVYPFADLNTFSLKGVPEKKGYFVVLSRLVSQKRIHIAVEACTKMSLKLKVIGQGPEYSRLKKIAGPSVEFLGGLPSNETKAILASASALIFTPEEDFGIVPVEAQAAGTPVIAFGRGGARETVIENVTGAFFNEPTSDSLISALRQWQPEKYRLRDLHDNAARFSRAHFQNRIEWILEKSLSLKEMSDYNFIQKHRSQLTALGIPFFNP